MLILFINISILIFNILNLSVTFHMNIIIDRELYDNINKDNITYLHGLCVILNSNQTRLEAARDRQLAILYAQFTLYLLYS